jgi:hypothetical protein
MQPNIKLIKINDNKQKIESFLLDTLFLPRLKFLQWANITKQSPSFKIGYPAQHLASLITGVEGGRSAARGDDLSDRSEIKGCNRVDQVDNCKNCKLKVLRLEASCSHCGSTRINRMEDSKWLITIKSEAELDMTLNKIPRFIFIVFYYPHLSQSDFNTVKIEAFEVWPKYNENFRQLATNYYHNLYLEHIKKNPKKTPAPQNFWPFSFQFYLCMPIKIFDCEVDNVNSAPKINIKNLVAPTSKRNIEDCEIMPTSKLTKDEIAHYGFSQKEFLSHADISNIALRDTQIAVSHNGNYRRS